MIILLVIRPVTGLIGLAGFRAAWREKLTIAFFGIRGVGSIYYLAYGLNHMEVDGGERLWAIAGLVILMSVLMHGLTVTPVMRLLDRKHGRDPDADATTPRGGQGRSAEWPHAGVRCAIPRKSRPASVVTKSVYSCPSAPMMLARLS